MQDESFVPAASDPTGNVAFVGSEWLSRPDTFGRDTEGVSMTAFPHVFAGLELLPGSGGYQLSQSRLFDGSVGRFARMDPLGVEGGPSRFTHAENDPTSLWDPAGLSAEGCGQAQLPIRMGGEPTKGVQKIEGPGSALEAQAWLAPETGGVGSEEWFLAYLDWEGTREVIGRDAGPAPERPVGFPEGPPPLGGPVAGPDAPLRAEPENGARKEERQDASDEAGGSRPADVASDPPPGGEPPGGTPANSDNDAESPEPAGAARPEATPSARTRGDRRRESRHSRVLRIADDGQLTRRERRVLLRDIARNRGPSGVVVEEAPDNRYSGFRERTLRQLRRLVFRDAEAAALVFALHTDPSATHRVSLVSTLGVKGGAATTQALGYEGSVTPGIGSGSTIKLFHTLREGGAEYRQLRRVAVEDQALVEGQLDLGVMMTDHNLRTVSVVVASTSALLIHELSHARSNQLGVRRNQRLSNGGLDAREEERAATTAENEYRARHDLPPRELP